MRGITLAADGQTGEIPIITLTGKFSSSQSKQWNQHGKGVTLGTIKNVIFDLGSVLITWQPGEFMLQFTGDKERAECFVEHVPRSELWFRLDQGLYSVRHARQIFLREYPEDADLTNYFFDHWFELFAPMQDTVALLRDVKNAGYRAYALSDFVKDAYEYVRGKFKFFELFDGEVISYQVKRVKPDLAIYHRLLAKYDLIPGECVFLDDTPRAIAAADSLGIPAILFLSAKQARADLVQPGVLI